jgi:hypothetical protein
MITDVPRAFDLRALTPRQKPLLGPLEKPDAAGNVTGHDRGGADGDRRVGSIAAMNEETGVGLEVPDL